jgi:hypothetical protein
MASLAAEQPVWLCNTLFFAEIHTLEKQYSWYNEHSIIRGDTRRGFERRSDGPKREMPGRRLPGRLGTSQVAVVATGEGRRETFP